MRWMGWMVGVALLVAGCGSHTERLGTLASDNAPPGPAQVAIFPDSPLENEPLYAEVVGTSWDADGDDVSYTLTWYQDGVLLGPAEFVGEGVTEAGEVWKVEVTPTDGTSEGMTTSDAVLIRPSAIQDHDGDGWTAEQGDCDDGDPSIHPGAGEYCDGMDNDCDGTADEGCDGGYCGDGITSGLCEECDGADDAGCPGRCSAHCACPARLPGELEIHMIDVWQGDAVAVVSPDGFVLLVDAGKGSESADLAAYLQSAGFDELDYTLVSHMHEDHLGSMDDVLFDHPEVVARFDHGHEYDTQAHDSYVSAAGECRSTVGAGDVIDLGSSVQADVIHGHTESSNENLNSLVLRVRYGDVGLLLGGDCETDGCEEHLDPGPIDVYKVHHHGSSDSTSSHLLDQMQPRVALIPVGDGNSYGHPHHEPLQRLLSHGVEVYRTDQDGDIVVVSDGESLSVDGTAIP